MKRLIYVRHGRKDGENIATEQLAEIQQNGIPGVNDLVKGQNLVMHEGSLLNRTKQTLDAFAWYLNHNPEHGCLITRWLPADCRLGNETMFARFLENGEIAAEAKNTNWLHAFSQHDVGFLIETQAEMMKAIKEIFAATQDDRTIISVGHTPLIEWVTYAFDAHDRPARFSRTIKLPELAGFVFTEDHGQISVTGTIGLQSQKIYL
jgi:broad specificity phosphatase PhoE